MQSAYAAGNYTALQLNYFRTSDKEKDYSSSGHGNYIEAAVGYYKPLHNRRWIFETYGGIGKGTVLNVYEAEKSSKFGITKFYVQPSFGYSADKFAIALSSKFATVHYNLKNSSVEKDDYTHDGDYIDYLNNRSFFLWGPGIMIRGGFKRFQFLYQATYSVPFNPELRLDNVNNSLGIIIPFTIKGKRSK